MKDGEFGEIYMSRGLCYKKRNTIGKEGCRSRHPAWISTCGSGPAPKRPFQANRFHYNWHWFWDTGNGDLGNQGIHEVDIAAGAWASTPSDEGHGDRRQVHVRRRSGDAEHLNCAYEFMVNGKPKMMEFEVRHWISNHEGNIDGERPGQYHRQLVLRSKGYL
jgi:hypothetical protein